METSKRRQIPTTTAYANFSSRGLRKKKKITLFLSFLSTSVTLRETTSVTPINYTLVSSGNHIQNIQIVRAHTGDFTMAAAGRAFGPDRAVPGIMYAV